MSLYVWDLTLKWKETTTDSEIIKALKSIAKKWGFQQEIGEKTGYRHYQIRMSLIKKTCKNRVIRLLDDTILQGAHVTPTSNGTNNDIYYYVTKKDTRVDATIAYTDKDLPPAEHTRQLLEFLNYELYKWQSQVLELCKSIDNRYINFILCPTGNTGKSIFCEFLEYRNLAEEIPTCNSMKDISAYICSRRTQGHESNCYLIDMPRGLKKEKLAQFFCGIEMLKNGVCYDERYTASKIRFDRPQIIVFTNKMPVEDLDILSKDRWRIHYLNYPTKELIDKTDYFLNQDYSVPLEETI